MIEPLQSLLDDTSLGQPWKPVPRPAPKSAELARTEAQGSRQFRIFRVLAGANLIEVHREGQFIYNRDLPRPCETTPAHWLRWRLKQSVPAQADAKSKVRRLSSRITTRPPFFASAGRQVSPP